MRQDRYSHRRHPTNICTWGFKAVQRFLFCTFVWMKASAVEAVREAQRVFCLSHPKPDGDAVGSLLGLYHALTALGKQVVPVLPDPVPAYLRFLPGADKIWAWTEAPERIAQAAEEADLFFCVDFGQWDRIPPALQALIDPERLVWVDHHADSEPLSRHWNLWDPAAAATCELLYADLLKPLCASYSAWLPMAARIALYTGLLTDTGGFRFRSVRPATLRLAAELIEPPFPLESVHHYVFQRKKLATLQLQSHLIQTRLRQVGDLPALVLPVEAAVLEAFGATWEDIETLPTQLLALEGTLLVAVIKEYPEAVRLSLRSVGDFPCHELAKEFDAGGGHRNAAGATLYRPFAEAVAFTEHLIQTKYAESLREHYRAFLAKLELQEQFG